jgi:3-hydroxybutyryl-CoA dehydrogenase
MTYQKVTIVGGGTLGSQIAYMSAFHGKDVTVWGRNDASIEKVKARIARWAEAVRRDLKASDAELAAATDHLHYETDLKAALNGADLVIEALPEVPATKTEFYEEFARLADPDTVVATNSSTLLPSAFAEATGRPEKFLAYHFANEIWSHNTAEIMAHAKTDPALPATFEAYSREIGMIPILVKKEHPAYVLNSLLVPLLDAGSDLWADEVADYETIDKTWMLATGAPAGPFGIMDTVGLNTVYAINAMNPDAKHQLIAKKVKEMIDAGHIGVESGEGFYKYPNPAYLAPDFLK